MTPGSFSNSGGSIDEHLTAAAATAPERWHGRQEK